ncbi:putative racemase [compost metagenome]
MEQDFYRGRLQEKHQIDVVTPDDADRAIVHRIIYDELCLGIIRDASRDEYRRIIGTLEAQGVEGIILGCTEITLLVGAEDAKVPVFDTTAIHALAAAEFALTQD